MNKTSQFCLIYSMTTKMELLTMTNSFTKSEEKSPTPEWPLSKKPLTKWIKTEPELSISMLLKLVMMPKITQMCWMVRELSKMCFVNIWKHLRLIICWEHLKMMLKWPKRNSLNITRTFLLASIKIANSCWLSIPHQVSNNNQTIKENNKMKDNQPH